MKIPLRRHRCETSSHVPEGSRETSRDGESWGSQCTAQPSRCPADSLEREILGHTQRVARLRFARGRLAYEFLFRKCWSALGFVRVSDYARESLGVAARTLQDDARAARAMERLPQTMIAFLQGRLTWTQVRILTLVAQGADEASWISLALESDTQTLSEKVRSRAGQGAAATIDSPGEPPTKFNVRVSRLGRRMWRVAKEMAERSAGSRLSPAQILELVAAEAASGAGGRSAVPRAENARDSQASDMESEHFHFPSEIADFAPPDSASKFSGAELDGTDFVPGPRQALERDPALAAFLRSLDSPEERIRPLSGQPSEDIDRDPELTRFLAEIEAEQAAAAAVGMGWSEYVRATEAAVPQRPDATQLLHEHLRQIAVDENLPSLVLPKRGDSHMERLEAMFDQIESREPQALDARLREIARALQRADADLARLLREALDLKLHRTRGFESFARYVEERLDFCSRRAWTLIAVDRAASRIGGDFTRAYREGKISLLAASAILPVVASMHGRAWVERAGMVTLRRLESEVEWALDQRDAASGEEGFAAPAPPPLDAPIDPCAGMLDRDGLKIRALEERPSNDVPAPEMRVTLCFSIPLSIAEFVEDTLMAVRRGSESRGEAFERMLALALLEWTSAPRHRDPIFERDGWLCAVPACSSRRDLHDHHVRFRSEGGNDSTSNRVAVCAAHHLRGIHMGRIHARGSAPSAIVWDFPHMRLLGDRYVVRPAAYSKSPANAVPNNVVSMPMFNRKIA